MRQLILWVGETVTLETKVSYRKELEAFWTSSKSLGMKTKTIIHPLRLVSCRFYCYVGSRWDLLSLSLWNDVVAPIRDWLSKQVAQSLLPCNGNICEFVRQFGVWSCALDSTSKLLTLVERLVGLSTSLMRRAIFRQLETTGSKPRSENKNST